jgi:hypothetical protein
MKYAEFDLGTIVYIIFLVLYGIYSMYKKSMKDAEKKYQQPSDPFPTSLPKQPQKPVAKKQPQPIEPKDIWKELMGEEATIDFPQERHLPEDRRQKQVEIKQKEVRVKKIETVRKPVTPTPSRYLQREAIKPSISEHASFLPGDFSIQQNEEGVAAVKDHYKEELTVDYHHNFPDDFDPRAAFKYAVLLEPKNF